MLMLRTFICGKFLTTTENNDQLSVHLLKVHASASVSFYCSFIALKEVRIVNKREVRRHGDGWGVFAPNARRASVVKPTQAEAQASGRTFLRNQGGASCLLVARTVRSVSKIRSSLGTTLVAGGVSFH